MTKRLFYLFALLFAMQNIVAQSNLTDKEIIEFVVKEQKKGNSKDDIVDKLKNKGAQDKTSAAKINRMRADEAIEKQKDQEVHNNMVGESNLSEDEKQVIYEDQLLTDDGVTYKEKVVFGRDIFNNAALTFEPSMNIPIPSNYILGAGDRVIIDIWGASQSAIEEVISPEGYIVVEGIGPMRIAGKTVTEANDYAKEVLGEVFSESSISLTVGSVRSIKVQVMGEVRTPGSYTVSALSTAFNALYAAGGINSIGTLRAINIYRAGKLLSTIDVYDYILKGKTAGDVRLQDNDVINVGPYDAVVTVRGKVKRPKLYEMKSGETLSTLLDFSGGFTGDAYKEKIRVVRKSNREYSMHTVQKDQVGNFELCDGDLIYIDSIIPRYSNMVEISGAVFYPGQYQYGDDVKTILDLINAAGGVREDAFLERVVLQHKNFDNTIEAQALDLAGILNGTSPDVQLRNNDAVFIPSESEMKGDQIVTIQGEVRFAGDYRYAENTTIEDLILQAGGLTKTASKIKVEVYRRIYDPYARTETKTSVESYDFELNKDFVINQGTGFVLQPYDIVNVRRSPVHGEMHKITASGEVAFGGEFVMTDNDYRLSDLIKAAGGFTSAAYAKGAYLTRRLTAEEWKQREVLLHNSKIELYEEAFRSNDVDIALLDSLNNAKLLAPDYYPVAINLEAALKNPKGEFDIQLREGDVLVVPKYSNTVKVSGEVRRPITLTWEEGKNLKYYVKHAGGFSDLAKKRDAYVIYMNGNVEKLSKSSKKIEPGCEIVIPRKSMNRTSAAEIMAYTTTATSIASMIALILTAIK